MWGAERPTGMLRRYASAHADNRPSLLAQAKYPPNCYRSLWRIHARQAEREIPHFVLRAHHPRAPIAEPASRLSGKPRIIAGPLHDPEDFSG